MSDIHIVLNLPWWGPAAIVTIIGLLIPLRNGTSGSGGLFGGLGVLFEYIFVFVILTIVWIVTAILK